VIVNARKFGGGDVGFRIGVEGCVTPCPLKSGAGLSVMERFITNHSSKSPLYIYGFIGGDSYRDGGNPASLGSYDITDRIATL
jgi:hypothetical protein